MDESGFEANTYRPYAWSKRGQKSYGERSGKRGTRTSLFLPPYSPDFNRIEQDFAIIKKRRIYSATGTSSDDIVKSYGNYLE